MKVAIYLNRSKSDFSTEQTPKTPVALYLDLPEGYNVEGKTLSQVYRAEADYKSQASNIAKLGESFDVVGTGLAMSPITLKQLDIREKFEETVTPEQIKSKIAKLQAEKAVLDSNIQTKRQMAAKMKEMPFQRFAKEATFINRNVRRNKKVTEELAVLLAVDNLIAKGKEVPEEWMIIALK